MGLPALRLVGSLTMLDRTYRAFFEAIVGAAAFLSAPRDKNPDQLTYTLAAVEVWSEQTGCAYLERSDGRFCCIVLLHRNRGANGGDWDWFVPTDSHANGFSGRVRDALYKTEQRNLKVWKN